MSISSTRNVALSGMTHQARRLEVSADNVANALTEGYRARQVEAVTAPDGGVESQVVLDPAQPPFEIGDDGTASPLSTTDLIKEQMTQVEAANAFAANAAVVKASGDMERMLIDLDA